jgi:hypothetical protein
MFVKNMIHCITGATLGRMGVKVKREVLPTHPKRAVTKYLHSRWRE